MASTRRHAGFALAAVLLFTVLPWIFLEGVYSLLKGPQAETSLAHVVWSRWLAGRPVRPLDPLDANTAVLHDVREIERLLPLFQAAGVGLGNSVFSKLRTLEIAMNDDSGPCRVQKPNLHKLVGFLRSNLFNPFDPITFFYDDDRVLPPELAQFFDRYAFRRVRHHSDAFGERLTLPAVEAPRKVLVAGDSVANGSMLDDAETLASQLQLRDGARQYLNLGIAGAKSADIACAIERATSRHRGQIDELVYVICENDWDGGDANADPDALIDWLESFRKRENVARVSLVYVPYIYNTSPELTRHRGHMLYAFPEHAAQKRRAFDRARSAGYQVVDYLEITDDERRRLGTLYASLAMYVDHAHPSPAGAERIAERLLAGRKP